jgi:hypothetical protein
MPDLAGSPQDGGGGAERSRFDENVLLGNRRDRGPDLRCDVSTGDYEYPLSGHEGFQPRDGLGDERPLADEREDLLRSTGR